MFNDGFRYSVTSKPNFFKFGYWEFLGLLVTWKRKKENESKMKRRKKT